MKKVLVTGGAGFIGSAVCRYLVKDKKCSVLNLDKLTYAGVPESLNEVKENPLYRFEQADICDRKKVMELILDFQPDAIMHLAAESHVDRSIDGPSAFIQTNIIGTYTMLDCALEYWRSLADDPQASSLKPQASTFRFHHISTDEVYGSLGAEGLFEETTPYDPRSPYSASKASSDHLVMAWHHTFGLPVVITNCSNNYGPYHFPEKLIPLVILNALDRKPLPVYGKGDQIRDWLYVEDHAKALVLVVEKGKVGETYNVGGRNERTNLEVVETICAILDELRPLKAENDECALLNDGGNSDQPSTSNVSQASRLLPPEGCGTSDVESGMCEQKNTTSNFPHPTSTKAIKSYRDLICFVTDRPGHDQRYAIDATKLETDLGWKALEDFDSGIKKTVQWYLDNDWWWKPLRAGRYAGERLGKC